jgi:hypothetical protein
VRSLFENLYRKRRCRNPYARRAFWKPTNIFSFVWDVRGRICFRGNSYTPFEGCSRRERRCSFSGSRKWSSWRRHRNGFFEQCMSAIGWRGNTDTLTADCTVHAHINRPSNKTHTHTFSHRLNHASQ